MYMRKYKKTLDTKKVMEEQKKSEETGEPWVLQKYRTAIWLTVPVQFEKGETIKHLQQEVQIYKDQYLTLDIYAKRIRKAKVKSSAVVTDATLFKD